MHSWSSSCVYLSAFLSEVLFSDESTKFCLQEKLFFSSLSSPLCALKRRRERKDHDVLTYPLKLNQFTRFCILIQSSLFINLFFGD